jgi:hypothetical protein
MSSTNCYVFKTFDDFVRSEQLFFDQSLLKKEDLNSIIHAQTWKIRGTPVFYPSKMPNNKIKQFNTHTHASNLILKQHYTCLGLYWFGLLGFLGFWVRLGSGFAGFFYDFLGFLDFLCWVWVVAEWPNSSKNLDSNVWISYILPPLETTKFENNKTSILYKHSLFFHSKGKKLKFQILIS